MIYFGFVKKYLTLLLALAVYLPTNAQSIAGYWYGSAYVSGSQGNQHNYLMELILTEKGNAVEGMVNYYFRNLYRSIPINGKIDRVTQQVTIPEVPFVYYGSLSQMEVDCQMNGSFQLIIARAGSTLSGQWKPTDAHKYTCPPIQTKLTLDREQPVTDSLIQAIKNWKEQYQVWSPSPDTDKETALTVTPRMVKNYVVVNEQASRKSELLEEIEIESDSVLINLYDNGEVDGDSISLFVNKKLIATHQRLSTRPIQLKLGLDSTQDQIELVMFAENVGMIPPNTALMIVQSNDKSYSLRLTSTLDKSAMVRIKRKLNKPKGK